MWDYTEKVMEHFRNPRNIGHIENPDGVGEVGSLACGDALRLMFKLDDDGLISDVKFQTFGCGSAIASSSALTEIIKGMTVEEAERVSNQDIAEFLGGLPEQKMHCSVMGREALEAAIANYRGEEPEGERKLSGEVTCVCFGVTEEVIERAIRDDGCHTVEAITNYTKAGGGCGGCIPAIENILERVLGEEATKPEPAKRRKLTNIQKIQLIQETIDTEIRPQLQQDGGDLELVDVEGDRVIVSLLGACHDCPVSQFTLKDMVETKLHEHVSPDLVVVEETAHESLSG
jgi:NifU-like protein